MAIGRAECAGGVLEIDLAGIVANWRYLARQVAPAACAAVVKADAYGLGAPAVATALAAGGCRRFFVATLDEALALRTAIPDPLEIAVFNGPPPGSAAEFVEHALVPVLNDPGQIEDWGRRRHEARAAAGDAPCRHRNGPARLDTPRIRAAGGRSPLLQRDLLARRDQPSRLCRRAGSPDELPAAFAFRFGARPVRRYARQPRGIVGDLSWARVSFRFRSPGRRPLRRQPARRSAQSDAAGCPSRAQESCKSARLTQVSRLVTVHRM